MRGALLPGSRRVVRRIALAMVLALAGVDAEVLAADDASASLKPRPSRSLRRCRACRPSKNSKRPAPIGRIIVQPEDVFDESLPGESGWLYRTANKIHIHTKPSVVRKQLLFKTGEPFRARLIEETERILRENKYLYDAKITPVAYDGKNVDLEVRTKDVWTLNPGINFSRQGGENEGGAQIEEKNLLGTGQGDQARLGEERRPRIDPAPRTWIRIFYTASAASASRTKTPTTAKRRRCCSTGRSTRSTLGPPAGRRSMTVCSRTTAMHSVTRSASSSIAMSTTRCTAASRGACATAGSRGGPQVSATPATPSTSCPTRR
jgi:hypothetical protein